MGSACGQVFAVTKQTLLALRARVGLSGHQLLWVPLKNPNGLLEWKSMEIEIAPDAYR